MWSIETLQPEGTAAYMHIYIHIHLDYEQLDFILMQYIAFSFYSFFTAEVVMDCFHNSDATQDTVVFVYLFIFLWFGPCCFDCLVFKLCLIVIAMLYVSS